MRTAKQLAALIEEATGFKVVVEQMWNQGGRIPGVRQLRVFLPRHPSWSVPLFVSDVTKPLNRQVEAWLKNLR